MWIRKLRWWLYSSLVHDLHSLLLSVKRVGFLGFISHVRDSNRETIRVKHSDLPLKVE